MKEAGMDGWICQQNIRPREPVLVCFNQGQDRSLSLPCGVYSNKDDGHASQVVSNRTYLNIAMEVLENDAWMIFLSLFFFFFQTFHFIHTLRLKQQDFNTEAFSSDTFVCFNLWPRCLFPYTVFSYPYSVCIGCVRLWLTTFRILASSHKNYPKS